MMKFDICEHCIELVDLVDECVQEYLRYPGREVPMVKLDMLRTLVRFSYRVQSSGYKCDLQSEVLREIYTTYVYNHYNNIGGHFRDLAFKFESWFPIEYPSRITDLEKFLGDLALVVPCPGIPKDMMMNYIMCLDNKLIMKLYGETDQEDEK